MKAKEIQELIDYISNSGLSGLGAFIAKTDPYRYTRQRTGPLAGGVGEVGAGEEVPRHDGLAHQDQDHGRQASDGFAGATGARFAQGAVHERAGSGSAETRGRSGGVPGPGAAKHRPHRFARAPLSV